MSWVVAEFIDVYGQTQRFRAPTQAMAANRFRDISWSYLGYPGITYRLLPDLGYEDCHEDGVLWAKAGERALEDQRRIPMTVAAHKEWVGITSYYEHCRRNGLDSGD